MKSSQIRQKFIDYFAAKGHQVVSSSSLVPEGDATLLFTNAGMVQFKDTFLGLEPRSYLKAVSSQRCVRAGGKHNDLDNVGYTARHHTFFEMLGNFSFGDYFKREAIQYAWGFLTEVLHLPPERLWVTIFHEDEEAADIWLKEVGVSPERFSRCGEEDNFWSMGDTGPCGPCTEIFYDHGADIAGGPPGSAEADGDRYIEIWNLVFMQYNRDKAGVLHPLPKPSVDTGMGLERIAAVVQGVHNNYEIDSFQYVIKALQQLAPTAIEEHHASLKVVADHIRACAFLIADGVTPSNEGRGYVLRRIIRRAVRHGTQLGLESPFFYKLVAPLIEVMGDAYPQLLKQQTHIERVLTQEENQFSRTLEHGLRLLKEQIQQAPQQNISGEVAFKLYDTYGFPVDLTADIAREFGLAVDLQQFNERMQQQREQSQSASQFAMDYNEHLTESSIFHGYESHASQGAVIALLTEGQRVDKIVAGDVATVILDETPFYAESGGQVGDSGRLLSDGILFEVNDTQRSGRAIAHHGRLVSGQLSIGQPLQAEVDSVRRDAIRLNHTATHLLHAALKQIVGSHVQQKGSLVDAKRARFDFSHHEGLTQAQLVAIEALVNEHIRKNEPVITEKMDIETAKQSGAVALFGEKYAEEVRVLSMGAFSKELCGGTHATRTGDIGLFKMIAEYGVASGVRRIEMVTGYEAWSFINEELSYLDQIALQLKTKPAQALEKLQQLITEHKQQEKEIAKLHSKLTLQSQGDLLKTVQTVGDIKLLVKEIEACDGQSLRNVLDQLKSSLDSAVIILYTIEEGNMQVVAGISKSLLGRVPSAGTFIKHLCGRGGGRDDMAQGGGPVPDNLSERLAQIPDFFSA